MGTQQALWAVALLHTSLETPYVGTLDSFLGSLPHGYSYIQRTKGCMFLRPEVSGPRREANWALPAAKGRFKGSPGVSDFVPEWLGPAAELISTVTVGISLPRAKEILLGAARYLGAGKGISREMLGPGEALDVKRILPILDYLVAKFGPVGAGEFLDARGTYLRWFVFGDRLQDIIRFFEVCGCLQEEVTDLLFSRKRNGELRKRGLQEIGVSGTSLRVAREFFRVTLECDDAEFIQCFLNNPEFFKIISFGPSDAPSLVVDFLMHTVGTSHSVMKRIILLKPSILTLSIRQMEKQLDYLKSLGVPNDQVARLLSFAPQILSTSVERMKGVTESWVAVGHINHVEILSLVLKAPVLVLLYNLSMSEDAGLKIQFLKHVLKRNVPDTLGKYPTYVGCKLLRICSRTEFLKRQGVDITLVCVNFLNVSNEVFGKRYAPADFSASDWDAFVAGFSLSDYREKLSRLH